MMINITKIRDGLPLFKALGSSTRIAIVELLAEKGPMRMTSIAQELSITGGALTSHMRLLEEANVVLVQQTKGKHGVQKVCRVNDTDVLVQSPCGEKGCAK